MANPTLAPLFGPVGDQPASSVMTNGWTDGIIPSGPEHTYLWHQLYEAANKSANDGIWDWEDPATSDREYNTGSIIRHSGVLWESTADSNAGEPGVGADWRLYLNGLVKDVDSFTDLQAVDTSLFTSVFLKELHTGIPKSGGNFTWDSTVDKSTANAGTIIDPSVSLANQGTGSGLGCWVRSNYTEICLSFFGLTDGGDIYDYLPSALSVVATGGLYNGVPITIRNGEYTNSGDVVIPPYITIKSIGIVRINYTGAGVQFTVKYSSVTDPSGDPDGMSQNPFNNSQLFDGSEGAFIFHGTGKTSGQTCFEFGDSSAASSSTRHTAWMSNSNLFVDEFQIGYKFNPNNVFIMRFYNCNSSGCGTIINTPNTANINAGEQIDWFGCAFHNSDQIMNLDCRMNMEFHGGSFDYGTGTGAAITISADFQKIRFIGGWIEAPSAIGQPFIHSTVADATRLHIDLSNAYIQPRDKLQCTLFTGKMSLALNGTTFVVNRFENYPNSANGINHFLCDDNVKVVSCDGNRFFDQMIQIAASNAKNINHSFETDAPGTTANAGAPTAITGWTHNGGAGAADLVVDNTQFNIGLQSVKIDSATGTYVSFQSNAFAITQRRLHSNLAIYSPSDTSVDVTMDVLFYDSTGALLSTSSKATTQSGLPSSWVSTKEGSYIEVPPGAVTARYRIIIGGFSADVWVDDCVIEDV